VQLGIGWQRRHASVGDGACFSIECGRADVVAELVDGDERALTSNPEFDPLENVFNLKKKRCSFETCYKVAHLPSSVILS
jgi:hypothetical protein